MPADHALLRAVQWVFAHDATADWAQLRILTTGPPPTRGLSCLHRLARRGATVHTLDHARTEARPGWWILYRPNLPVIAATADLPAPHGMIIVGAPEPVLQPWVEAHHPLHLGGKPLTPAEPLIGDPRVHQVLEQLTTDLPRQLLASPACHTARLTAAVHRLRRQGCALTAEQLLTTALRLNWPGWAAEHLYHTAQHTTTHDRHPAAPDGAVHARAAPPAGARPTPDQNRKQADNLPNTSRAVRQPPYPPVRIHRTEPDHVV